MPHPLIAVEQAATIHKDAKANHDQTRKQLHTAIRQAAERGADKTQLATVAGVSRQTVYDILR